MKASESREVDVVLKGKKKNTGSCTNRYYYRKACFSTSLYVGFCSFVLFLTNDASFPHG